MPFGDEDTSQLVPACGTPNTDGVHLQLWLKDERCFHPPPSTGPLSMQHNQLLSMQHSSSSTGREEMVGREAAATCKCSYNHLHKETKIGQIGPSKKERKPNIEHQRCTEEEIVQSLIKS